MKHSLLAYWRKLLNNDGTLTVADSTISNNSASGGGIFSDTNLSGPITTTIENSTISGNSADSVGGGVYNYSGLTTIRTTTITNNSAPENRGAGVSSYGDNQTSTVVGSSIISANSTTDVDFVSGSINSFSSEGYNVIGDGNATSAFNQTGDQTEVSDPKLGALADNGGPTKTHALLSGSPAIDKGDDANCPQTDQRGVTRPQDGDNNGSAICDIGAFEVAAAPPPPSTGHHKHHHKKGHHKGHHHKHHGGNKGGGGGGGGGGVIQ